MGDTIADEDIYTMLYNIADKYSREKEPFFLTTYTVGTHATFDSSNQIYGDGSDRELNKFYNVDYHFGSFMEKFEQSSLAEDTIVIFTTDHAT